MSKAFTSEETDPERDEENEIADELPREVKNYMTPDGFKTLQEELRQLLYTERPKIVDIVSWAAGNGDRSENGDYIYGKKRLREIDRRVRYLSKRLESAEVVEPEKQKHLKQIFFGATVTYVREDDAEVTIQIVGIDEADATQGKISWLSPVAKALLKKQVGDSFTLHTPAGVEMIEVVSIYY